MPIRVFLRGGYKQISEPTVVSSHGYPIFTVMPGGASARPVIGDSIARKRAKAAQPELRDHDLGVSDPE